MADTVFKADFRGSCMFDPTGLKEDDSSVEIYVQNIFNMETTHKHTHTFMQRHPHTPMWEDKYKTHAHKEDSTDKGTDDRETEKTC